MRTVPSTVNNFNIDGYFAAYLKEILMRLIHTIIFIYILSKLSKKYKNLSFSDLNFRRLDFTNYKQIKLFIFKKFL